MCEWKGQASYYTVQAGGAVAPDAAWGYKAPTPAFAAIAGHVAVYAGRMDACYVDDDRVVPQEGGFYGGWITPDLMGPFKGAPGTHSGDRRGPARPVTALHDASNPSAGCAACDGRRPTPRADAANQRPVAPPK